MKALFFLAACSLIPLATASAQVEKFVFPASEVSGLPGLSEESPVLPSKTEIQPGVFLRDRPLARRSNECQNCHLKKEKIKIPPKTKTKLEHQPERHHGSKQIACNFCHDQNNHNFLRSTDLFPASFANTSGVCKRCHAEDYYGWLEGLHGKRSGGWNSRKKIQFNCIDCHNPHDVSFKKMKALPEPPAPRAQDSKSNPQHTDK